MNPAEMIGLALLAAIAVSVAVCIADGVREYEWWNSRYGAGQDAA